MDMSVDEFLSGGFEDDEFSESDSDAQSQSESELELDSDSDSDSDMDEESDSESESEDEMGDTELPSFTTEVYDSLVKDLEKVPTISNIKKLVNAFVSAVYMGEKAKGMPEPVWKFGNHHVFNRVVDYCLSHIPDIVNRYQNQGLTDKKKKNQRGQKLISKLPHWKSISSVLSTFLRALIHFLSQVSEPGMVTFVLHQTEAFAPIWMAFERLAEKFLKVLLQVWSNVDSTEWPTTEAYSAIRILAVALPSTFTEKCMCGMYLSFIKSTSTVNVYTSSRQEMMAKCVVGLYNVDFSLAYQLGFTFIRQLSLHLRNALQGPSVSTSKSKSKSKAEAKIKAKAKKSKSKNDDVSPSSSVYSWMFVSAVRVWSKILSVHSEASELRPLFHPLSEVSIGAINLIPTARFYPFRLKLVASLIDLMNIGVYIPLSATILDMLEPAWYNSAKTKSGSRQGKTKGKGVDLDMMLKVPPSMLNTYVFKVSVAEDAIILLCEYLTLCAEKHSLSFPELAFPVLQRLRHSAKDCKVPVVVNLIKTLVRKVEMTNETLKNWRDRLDIDLRTMKDVSMDLDVGGDREKLQYNAESEGEKLPVVVLSKIMRAKRDGKVLLMRTNAESEDQLSLYAADERAYKEDGDEVMSPKSQAAQAQGKGQGKRKRDAAKTDTKEKKEKKEKKSKKRKSVNIEEEEDVIAPINLEEF